MSNVFSLDQLREEVEREFAPFVIELSDGSKVTLRNLIRLGANDRKRAAELLDELANSSTADEDLITLVEGALSIIADRGNKLVKEINGDLSLALKVLGEWAKATQSGEAENSPAS